MAAAACLGEFPELTEKMFTTGSSNAAGGTAVRFYIRGKPWVVSVDDRLWFASSELVFADRSKDGNAIWAAILEKAWAKVKGNYVNSNGDLM